MSYSEGGTTETATLDITILNFVSPAEVIVDNDGPGTSYTGGEWGYSSGANPYGGSSRTEKEPGAAYTFETPLSGSYEVSLWWTYWSSRCTEVPVDIYDGDSLLATVRGQPAGRRRTVERPGGLSLHQWHCQSGRQV